MPDVLVMQKFADIVRLIWTLLCATIGLVGGIATGYANGGVLGAVIMGIVGWIVGAFLAGTVVF